MTRSGRAFIQGLPWGLVAGVRFVASLAVPPHEPREVARALLVLLEKPSASLDDVLRVLRGPDFVGGGEVVDAAAVRSLYETGAGTVGLRSTVEIQLPSRIVVSVPGPSGQALESQETIQDAIQASRLDGAETASFGQGVVQVTLARGADVARLRRQIEELLPLEREATYRLPWPLVDGLRAFIEEKRARGLTDAAIRGAIAAARPPGPADRRTRIA
jgi:hypothetical protein